MKGEKQWGERKRGGEKKKQELKQTVQEKICGEEKREWERGGNWRVAPCTHGAKE